MSASTPGERTHAWIVTAALVLCAVLAGPAPADAQWSRNVLLVTNSRSAASREIADYYAQKRAISTEQIVRVDVPAADEISRADYDALIERPIAAWLVSHSAQDRILYIVLTKDVPLRVSGTGGQDGTVASVDSELALLYRKFTGQSFRLTGSVPNPYFLGDKPLTAAQPFTRRAYDIYLVARLDGYSVADVKGLIDRGSAPAKQGAILLDGRSELMQSIGNKWLVTASGVLNRMPGWGDRVVLDTSAKVLRGAADVFGYYSWGSNDPAIKDRHLQLAFAPGAIGAQFVSTDGRTFTEPPAEWTTNDRPYRGSHQSLTADLIRDGITGVAGHVAEPYLSATIRPDILFPAYLSGYNLVEAFYLSMPLLSWQTVVIGDPLCAPFRARPIDQTDLDAPIDPGTELPGFLSGRRLAALVASGAPRDAAALMARAEVRLSKADAAGARELYERATAVAPAHVPAQLALATLYERSSNWDGAIARYRKVIEVKPDDGTALNNLAYALATRKNDPAAALPFAKRAYTSQPNNGAATDTLAWVQHLLGNDAEALPLIATAARQMPNSAEVRLHAAVILASTGNPAAAKDELEKALALDKGLDGHPAVEALRKTLGLTN